MNQTEKEGLVQEMSLLQYQLGIAYSHYHSRHAKFGRRHERATEPRMFFSPMSVVAMGIINPHRETIGYSSLRGTPVTAAGPAE